jgi:guanylate cyclase
VTDSTFSLITLCTYSYDLTIRATGRYFSDFLQNVDNIHMQMCFTYPKMKSPSMYITHIDPQGVVLVYRSSRKGFTEYLMGKYRLPYYPSVIEGSTGPGLLLCAQDKRESTSGFNHDFYFYDTNEVDVILLSSRMSH